MPNLDGKFEAYEILESDEKLESYINKYQLVLDSLLEEDETFIDFINKTLIYSAIGKKNPAYVSQSPLQLSGEFTQKEFLKEIEGVPIVLMPIDEENYRLTSLLDEIPNAYRYYRVSEYIYKNYIPLCKYGTDYAIWCLKDRVEEYQEKIGSVICKVECVYNLKDQSDIIIENMNLSFDEEGMTAVCTGFNPMISELQNAIDTSSYVGSDMKITMQYESDTTDTFQLFYTTEVGENYTEDKVITVECGTSGTAEFIIPITEYSRLRLDMPREGTIKILSLEVGSPCEYINYGYDGPIESVDKNNIVTCEYVNVLHNYSIGQLPRIWAENDKKHANDNQVMTQLNNEAGTFIFDTGKCNVGDSGNYLKITAMYDGVDIGGSYHLDDEQISGTVRLGHYDGNEFTEKCRYVMSFKEGKHDYLIRCSTDYYWSLGEINAVKIQTEEVLHNVEMKILEGD